MYENVSKLITAMLKHVACLHVALLGRILRLAVALLLFLSALPLWAQSPAGSARARLSAEMAECVPFLDTVNHIALTQAELGESIVFLTLDFGPDTKVWEQDSILGYLCRHHDWLMRPIVVAGYAVNIVTHLQAPFDTGYPYQSTAMSVHSSERVREAYTRANSGVVIVVNEANEAEIMSAEEASIIEEPIELNGSMPVSSSDTHPAAMMRIWTAFVRADLPARNDDDKYTVQELLYDSVENCVHLTMRYDDGLRSPDREELLRSLVDFDTLELGRISGWDCELNVLAKSCPYPHFSNSAEFRYSAAEIARADSVVVSGYALQYIQRVGDTLPLITPITLGEGETLVTGYYDGEAKQLVYVFEYSESLWPDVRRYLTEHLDEVRSQRALGLVRDEDDVNLAYAAYSAGVALRHVYFNQRHTDSVEMFIAPWMWEPLMEGAAESSASEQEEVSVEGLDEAAAVERLLYEAELFNRECPHELDGMTMRGCFFDTVSRVFHYVYELDDMTMLQLENTPNVDAPVRANMRSQIETNDEFRRFVRLVVRAGAAISYDYSSSRAKRPIVVFFSTEELKEGTGDE